MRPRKRSQGRWRSPRGRRRSSAAPLAGIRRWRTSTPLPDTSWSTTTVRRQAADSGKPDRPCRMRSTRPRRTAAGREPASRACRGTRIPASTSAGTRPPRPHRATASVAAPAPGGGAGRPGRQALLNACQAWCQSWSTWGVSSSWKYPVWKSLSCTTASDNHGNTYGSP